jgi:serine/threonine protein kinase
MDLSGATLGPYRITREIGRGGMAIVYEAYQASLNRTVAIKVLPQQFTFDREFVARFQREARSAARLSHPNIVPIYDVGQQDGWHYIVMRFLAGEPLSALASRQGRMPLDRAIHIIEQIASALDYAHAQGIIHRDIKPGNIIVGRDDSAVLTDFGIAKAAESTALTRTGALVGTPEYMSPEQARGAAVGPASDLYSLAVVLYQMLTGHVPFEADSTPAILYKQMHDPPVPARAYLPGLPAAVEAALARALAKDPAARYRSAGEFAAALRAANSARSPAAQTEPATVLLRGPQAAPPAGGRVPRAFLIMGALGALLLIAGVGSMVFSGGKPGPGATPTPTTPVETATAPASATHGLSPTPIATSRTPTAAPPSRTPIPQPAPEPVPGTINAEDTRVRSGPGLGFFVMGSLSSGAAVTVTGRTADGAWLHIEADSQRRGWVSREYIRTSVSLAPAPVVPTPALLKSIQVAHARMDFSSEQGEHDWFYLISDAPGSLQFTRMPWDAESGKWYRWCCDPRYDARMRLSDAGGHPSRTHDVARLWVSPYAGTLRIAGQAYKEAGDGLGGNGVALRIVSNKTTLWEGRLGATQTTPLRFDLAAAAKPGDQIYFIIGANGEDNKDNTIFEPTVELQQADGVAGLPPASWAASVSTPTPTQAASPLLCFAPRRRHYEQHLGCCAEVAGLVYNLQGRAFRPNGGVIRIEGPPASNQYIREFAVAADGGYSITALSVDAYTIWLKGPGISSQRYQVRYTDPAKIREIVDFYQVPCQ